jgi:hypothetical protein
MEEMRSACKSLVEKAVGGHHFRDPGIDEMIMLKGILKTWYEDVD